MVIVVPLGAEFSRPRGGARIEQIRRIVVVLDHQMDHAPGAVGERARCAAELREHARLAALGDGLNCVEAQPVEAIAIEPVQRVLDREGAHLRHPIVDRLAPRRRALLEEAGRVAAEVIPLRTEVIVDDVEKGHEPARVRGIDQRTQIVGTAVGTVGRVEQHTVITPVAAAGEISHRHQLDRGEAGVDHVIELVDGRAEGALGREGADMQLEDDGLFPRTAAPVRRAPLVGRVIDDLARAHHVVGLERRGGIGNLEPAIDAESIMRAGTRIRERECVPAVRLRRHRRGAIGNELDRFRRRRPQSKRRAGGGEFRPELKAAHAAPANTSTERGGAFPSVPDRRVAVSPPDAIVVSSSSVQRAYSGSFGSV